MARLGLHNSPSTNGRLLAVFILGCALYAPVAVAQRPGGHVVGGHAAPGPHISAPHFAPPPVSRPPIMASRPVTEPGAHGFGPFPIFFPRHRPFFFAQPFFGFGAELWLESYWWMNCGSPWTWQFGCYGLPNYGNVYGSDPETYQAPQPYPVQVYVYGHEQPDFVQLYLTDGRMYNVADYWFVNDQIHFTMTEQLPDGATKPVERAIPFEDLDLQTTIQVNSRRGFRFVMRDEPWEKYLHDHPDTTPPLVTPPKS